MKPLVDLTAEQHVDFKVGEKVWIGHTLYVVESLTEKRVTCKRYEPTRLRSVAPPEMHNKGEKAK